jgi:hypothetical protein
MISREFWDLDSGVEKVLRHDSLTCGLGIGKGPPEGGPF